MNGDEITTFYSAENFKAFITTRGGVVVDVDIVENKLTPAQRHEVISTYRKTNRKPKQRTRLLYCGGDLLEYPPNVDGL